MTVNASDATYNLGNPTLGPRGLAAEGVGAVLNATNFNINLSHTGSSSAENGTGLRAVSGGTLTAIDGTVTMTGNWNHGIVASAGTVTTNAAIVVNGGATAGSTVAYGAFAIGEAVSQFGPSTIFLLPGSSVTNHHGEDGIGLYALNFPQGTSTIESYATVFTDGALAGYGALAQDGGHILLHGGSVTTTGTQSHGLWSFAPGSLIRADAAFGGVQTSGNSAHGARATGGVIELNGTTILTTGAGAHGILAETRPDFGFNQGGRVYPTGAVDPAVAAGDVTVIFNRSATASGQGSHGIFAIPSTFGNAYVETSGAVLGGWGVGATGLMAAIRCRERFCPRLIFLAPWLTFEPQIQGIWQRVSLDNTLDQVSTITFDRSDVYTGRAGALLRGSFGSADALWQPYLKGNVWWGTNGFDTVTFGIDPVQTGRQGGTAVEGGGGVTGKLTRYVSVYGDASYLTAVSGESRDAIKGNVGLRVTW